MMIVFDLIFDFDCDCDYDYDYDYEVEQEIGEGFLQKCQITPEKRGWRRDSHNPQRGSSLQRMGFGQEGTQDWPANRSICALLHGRLSRLPQQERPRHPFRRPLPPWRLHYLHVQNQAALINQPSSSYLHCNVSNFQWCWLPCPAVNIILLLMPVPVSVCH